jgi:hypothetical protein
VTTTPLGRLTSAPLGTRQLLVAAPSIALSAPCNTKARAMSVFGVQYSKSALLMISRSGPACRPSNEDRDMLDERNRSPLPPYSSSPPGVFLSMKCPNAGAMDLAGSSCHACASKATMRRPCFTIETLASLSSAGPKRR